ncbi:MAG: response regulator transcription factor [Chloroflexi bacterium]|nr:response regulator transcription factor [Chloroflexota bacterium]MCC6895415.1 response regulator transcription factor [Anaerolineae bacterium]
MADLKVLLVAENPLARMGLAALLAGIAGLTVAGQSSGNQLHIDIDLARPHVIAWDWGWNTTPELPRDVPVVALLKEPAQAVEAWRAGARGLLLGSLDPDTLVAALNATAHGLAVIEPALAMALTQLETTQIEALVEALTPREMEVLQLLASGLPNKTIANRLSITDHTVKFHVNAIMTKLGVQSRTEAVVRATKLGLIIL